MIKARELMIANYVKAENNLCIITCVNIEYCVGYGVETNVFYSSPFLDCLFEPIPLTEEWLLKFGFIKIGRAYKLKLFGKFIFYHGFEFPSFYPAGSLLSLMRGDALIHVHQLQNLYFALTGEELIIK